MQQKKKKKDKSCKEKFMNGVRDAGSKVRLCTCMCRKFPFQTIFFMHSHRYSQSPLRSVSDTVRWG